MNSHHRVSRFLPLGLPLLAAASLLAAPAPAFADSKSQSSSGQKRASSPSKKQSTRQQQTKREARQYKHYESGNRVRGFHDNPDRQPHFIENRLGFKIGF